MSVKVLFFGATADIVGTRLLTVSAVGESAADLRSRLAAEYPRLGGLRLLLSINQEYSSDDRQLLDGDEVAVFTAVSGG